MQTFLSIQHWLYSGMGEGLGAIAGGDPRAILLEWPLRFYSARSMR